MLNFVSYSNPNFLVQRVLTKLTEVFRWWLVIFFIQLTETLLDNSPINYQTIAITLDLSVMYIINLCWISSQYCFFRKDANIWRYCTDLLITVLIISMCFLLKNLIFDLTKSIFYLKFAILISLSTLADSYSNDQIEYQGIKSLMEISAFTYIFLSSSV
jgi:hypothetical protein